MSATPTNLVRRSLTVGFDVTLGEARDELLAKVERLGHVDRDAELEHRRRPGLGESPRDRLAGRA